LFSIFQPSTQRFFFCFCLKFPGIACLLIRVSLRWGWIWAPWWIDADRGKQRYSKKTCSIATLFSTDHIRNGPRTKPGFHEERPAPKHPKHHGQNTRNCVCLDTAPSAPILTELRNTLHYYGQISYTEFLKYRAMNVAITDIFALTLRSKA